MEESDGKRLALVLAEQAEIEGMKAANALREQNNESPAYGESEFSYKAQTLRDLAYKHRDQL